MPKRCETAACSDRSLLGDNRMDAAIQHFTKHVDDLATNSAEAEREHIRAQQHHGADFRLGEWRGGGAGMAAEQNEVENSQFVMRNAHVGEFSEAGIYAIDHRIAFNNVLDDLSRSVYAFASSCGDLNGFVPRNNRSDLLERQRLAVQFHAEC